MKVALRVIDHGTASSSFPIGSFGAASIRETLFLGGGWVENGKSRNFTGFYPQKNLQPRRFDQERRKERKVEKLRPCPKEPYTIVNKDGDCLFPPFYRIAFS
jgi:hypothetical protein